MLVSALILGSLGRTGLFIWSIPAEVNLTVRHLGMLFFLAAIGIRAGHGLTTILKAEGLILVLLTLGILVIAYSIFLPLLWFSKQRKAPTLLGAIAGFQTQPAVLAFANDKVPTSPLNISYATTYPLGIILKIVLAQFLVSALS